MQFGDKNNKFFHMAAIKEMEKCHLDNKRTNMKVGLRTNMTFSRLLPLNSAGDSKGPES